MAQIHCKGHAAEPGSVTTVSNQNGTVSPWQRLDQIHCSAHFPCKFIHPFLPLILIDANQSQSSPLTLMRTSIRIPSKPSYTSLTSLGASADRFNTPGPNVFSLRSQAAYCPTRPQKRWEFGAALRTRTSVSRHMGLLLLCAHLNGHHSINKTILKDE